MNKRFSIGLAVLIFLGGGCMGNADELIKGSEHEYMIPGKYIKDTGSLIFPKSFEADESKSISLFVTNKNSKYFSDWDDFGVSILVFLDRQYDHSSGLRADSETIVSESSRAACSRWAACYKRNFGGQITNYYFTFDPEKDDSGPLTSEDYILSVKPAQSLSVGEIKTQGKDTCSYHSVLDGMLLQVATSGEICSEDKVGLLVTTVSKLFAEWRL